MVLVLMLMCYRMQGLIVGMCNRAREVFALEVVDT